MPVALLGVIAGAAQGHLCVCRGRPATLQKPTRMLSEIVPRTSGMTEPARIMGSTPPKVKHLLSACPNHLRSYACSRLSFFLQRATRHGELDVGRSCYLAGLFAGALRARVYEPCHAQVVLRGGSARPAPPGPPLRLLRRRRRHEAALYIPVRHSTWQLRLLDRAAATAAGWWLLSGNSSAAARGPKVDRPCAHDCVHG